MPFADRTLEVMDAATAEYPLTPQQASNVLFAHIERHHDLISRIDLAAMVVAIEYLDSYEPDTDNGEAKEPRQAVPGTRRAECQH